MERFFTIGATILIVYALFKEFTKNYDKNNKSGESSRGNYNGGESSRGSFNRGSRRNSDRGGF